MDRRELLKRLIKGGIGSSIAVEQLLGVPMLQQLLAQYALRPLGKEWDSCALIQNLLQGGDALLRTHQAMAQGTSSDDWTVVTIKVVNHIAFPLLYILGSTDSNGNQPSNSRFLDVVGTKVGNASCRDHLIAGGIRKLSDDPKFAAGRFNKWFADIVRHGTRNGKPSSDSNATTYGAGVDSLTGDFPSDVAIQTAMVLNQAPPGDNHNLKGFKLDTGMPDLALMLAERGLIYSPLGITCFMMGGLYDAAEGDSYRNLVCSAIGENAAVNGRSVLEYYNTLKQSSTSPYMDKRRPPVVNPRSYRVNLNTNMIFRLDQLVTDYPQLRKELLNTQGTIASSIDNLLLPAVNLEQDNPQTFDAEYANGQTNMTGAGKEFLAQVAYTAGALDIPGQPIRNFSLFLNTIDLDRKGIDAVGNDVAEDRSLEARIKALTYVEGMRQLAVGLNILAKKIKEKGNVIVQVVTEGGRSPNMDDSTGGAAIVMGPKGPGLLTDGTIGQSSLGNSQSNIVADPATLGNITPFDGGELRNADGTANTTAIPHMGNFQMGVAEFLAERTGRTAALSGIDLAYIRLLRGS